MMYACRTGVSPCTCACLAKTDVTRTWWFRELRPQFVHCVYRRIAVTLVSRHGKIIYCEGTGLQNDGTEASLTDTPVSLRPDTIFRI